MKKNPIQPTALLWLLLLWMVPACVVEPIGTDNITPRADLAFTVVDDAGNPIPNAQVYLFPFRTPYENYLGENPDGDPSLTPAVDPEDAATTDGQGQVTFTNRELEGTSYAQGETFIHQPNPIYFRVLADYNGEFVTNDRNDPEAYLLTFPELESGEVILEEVEVVLR